ncbi:MAG: AtpZ/AtpI family protein [Erysipelotrichales bacterium]|nr:AtpZ/AtpI family protein [Erysipelotrichales bacterium]
MMKDIEKGISLAITIIGCITSCFGMGYMLDKWLSTTPIFMIIGIFSGTGLAFWYLYHIGTSNEKK